MTGRVLTPDNFREMPWANGLGSTVEMMRVEGDKGAMAWRLSMAQVVEDGAFSEFAGIERNLTVIDGPGFDLVGDNITLRADPLEPVAFAGDIKISAANVTGKLIDFNVMVARSLGAFTVLVLRKGEQTRVNPTLTAVFALGAGDVVLDSKVQALGHHNLWIGKGVSRVENAGSEPVIVVNLPV